jgi:excisionase family DNA binding protein
LTEPVRRRLAADALLRKPLWSPEDLALYLDLPVKTIYKQRADGDLCPGYRFGKHLRFKRDEVLAWIETRRDEA